MLKMRTVSDVRKNLQH